MTTRRARLGLGLIGFLLLVGTGLWWFWLLPAQFLALVGMKGPWLTSHRTCERTVDGRLIRCDGPPVVPYHPINEEVVLFSARTRHPVFLDRMWDAPDSIAWARQRDSIRFAMRSRHEAAFTCEQQDLLRERLAEIYQVRPDAGGARSVDDWRFPHGVVQLMTYKWPPSGASPKERWSLQLTATPNPSPICQTPRIVRHLMTWDEFTAGWRDWLADQFR